ncbi:MAG TPA: SGNH/GDSL hydrolase family protein [Bryobacteraceae bacterium]|nr:SGNH/GDSL hydrolase family protein [Bryobacteraceae bacterium]
MVSRTFPDQPTCGSDARTVEPGSRRPGVLRAASLILLNTLLLAALAESIARVAEWVRPERAELAFEYAPYRMLRTTRAPWPLNREGFRAAELESYRGSFLIEFLGGSVCLGVGTDPGPVLTERLEQALHQAGLERARVLNLCQSGATSAQELAIFLQYGLPLKPQVVISFNGANDLLHPQPTGDDEAPNLPYRNRELEARFAGSAARDLGRHLAVVRIAGRLARRGSSEGGGTAVELAAIVDSYVQTLDSTRVLTEASGGLYAVALQPALHLEKPWSADESAMWRRRRPDRGEWIRSLARERFTFARTALVAWGAKTRTSFYDLTRVFRSTPEPVYSDSVHFTGERGYRMLFEELERQGLVREITQRYGVWAGQQ